MPTAWKDPVNGPRKLADKERGWHAKELCPLPLVLALASEISPLSAFSSVGLQPHSSLKKDHN